MAFGDITENDVISAQSAATISETFEGSQTSTDLSVACHFTGATNSNVDTAGFVEDQLLTNSTENDEGAFYSDLGANTVTCSGGTDEHMLSFYDIEGPFDATPADISQGSGRITADPAATGASAGNTAQADEVLMAMTCIRSTGHSHTWTREGTATPTSAMTDGGGSNTSTKQLTTAHQTLTGVGTVGVSVNNSGGPVIMVAVQSYKKEAVGGVNPKGPLGMPLRVPFTGPLG